MRTYIPEQYFERVGYQGLPEDYALCAQGKHGVVTGKIRVDALGQRVRERFNEDLQYDDKVSASSKQ